MASSKYAIKVRGLKKAYGSNEVLKGVDLSVAHGSMLALLGPNGAGKTTTVRILSTLLNKDAGSVTVSGYDLDTQADCMLAVVSS